MKKYLLIVLIALFATQLPAYVLNIKLGAFHPLQRSDLWEINYENLIFNKSELTSFFGAVEFEFPAGRYATITFEIGSYKRKILSEYRDYEYTDGSPIKQNFSLRITPYEIGIKLYPLSYRTLFSPYISIGAGLYQWRYHQWGKFINFKNYSISDGDAYTDSLTFGLFAKGGFLYRFQRSMGISLEARYQRVKGELSGYFEGFDRFDLSGWGALFGLNLFF